MGYYSDVAITMRQNDFNDMVKYAVTKNNDYALRLIKSASLYENDIEDTITMLWNCIKWYEDYEDVSFITEFIMSNGVQHHFIRIGEDMSDVETRYTDDVHESTYVESYINTDCAGKCVDSALAIENIIKQQETIDEAVAASERELQDFIDAVFDEMSDGELYSKHRQERTDT